MNALIASAVAGRAPARRKPTPPSGSRSPAAAPRFSRSSSFTRSASAELTPGRAPPSISACRTHLRSVSVVIPSLPAIDAIAAHSDAYSRGARAPSAPPAPGPPPDTARLAISPILSSDQASTKPGAVQVVELFETVARIAPGSYGILLTLDDEAGLGTPRAAQGLSAVGRGTAGADEIGEHDNWWYCRCNEPRSRRASHGRMALTAYPDGRGRPLRRRIRRRTR